MVFIPSESGKMATQALLCMLENKMPYGALFSALPPPVEQKGEPGLAWVPFGRKGEGYKPERYSHVFYKQSAVKWREFDPPCIADIKITRPSGRAIFIWRRRGDSNSRYRSPHTNDLANRPLQPLGYSSSSAAAIAFSLPSKLESCHAPRYFLSFH